MPYSDLSKINTKVSAQKPSPESALGFNLTSTQLASHDFQETG